MSRADDKWGDRKRARKLRNFMVNTCPSSRHAHMMADALWDRQKYHMFDEEPRHCATALYSVLGSLWEARNALIAMRPEGIADDPDGAGWWWASKDGRKFLKAKE